MYRRKVFEYPSKRKKKGNKRKTRKTRKTRKDKFELNKCYQIEKNLKPIENILNKYPLKPSDCLNTLISSDWYFAWIYQIQKH